MGKEQNTQMPKKAFAKAFTAPFLRILANAAYSFYHTVLRSFHRGRCQHCGCHTGFQSWCEPCWQALARADDLSESSCG